MANDETTELAKLTPDALADEMLKLRDAGLADGAGAVSVQRMAKLFAMFDRVKLLACAEAVRCLGAGKEIWRKDTEQWETMIDYQCRLKACEFIRDTMEGKPAQTTFQLSADVTGGKLGAGDLLAGPEAASRLRALADQVEKSAASGGGQPKRVKAAKPAGPVVDGETA